MKKRIYGALLLLLCLSASGCARQQKQSGTESLMEETAMLETEAETESETENERATEKKAVTDVAERNTVIGSLMDISMEQMTLLTDNGNEIILPLEGAELDFRGGFRLGNLVSVEYTGEITETDSRNGGITVLRAADSADVQELRESAVRRDSGDATGESSGQESTDTEGASAEEESTKSTESEDASGAEEIRTMQGTLKEMSLNHMTMLTEEKKEQTFGIMNTRMYFLQGMKPGMKIEVSYTEKGDSEDKQVISVKQE